MKKLIILSVFIANYSFAQSVTIVPNTPLIRVLQSGIGLDHRITGGTVGVGTFAASVGGYIQTHTNHPLFFATNNGTAQMVLLTNGNFGIGNNSPTQKLHVQGNGYFTGNLDTDGLVTAGTLNIGGGTTINKYFETLLTAQQIALVFGNACNTQFYTVTGADIGDTVILNIETAFSNSIDVSNVRVNAQNQIEVKFCNISASNTALQTGISMRFTVVK